MPPQVNPKIFLDNYSGYGFGSSSYLHGSNNLQKYLCWDIFHRGYGEGQGNVRIKNVFNFNGFNFWGGILGGVAFTLGSRIGSWANNWLWNRSYPSWGFGNGGWSNNNWNTPTTATTPASTTTTTTTDSTTATYNYSSSNKNKDAKYIDKLSDKVGELIARYDKNPSKVKNEDIIELYYKLNYDLKDDVETNTDNDRLKALKLELEKKFPTLKDNNATIETVNEPPTQTPTQIQTKAVSPQNESAATPVVDAEEVDSDNTALVSGAETEKDDITAALDDAISQTQNLNDLTNPTDIYNFIQNLSPTEAKAYLGNAIDSEDLNYVKGTYDYKTILLANKAGLKLRCAQNETFINQRNKSDKIEGEISNVTEPDKNGNLTFEITAESGAKYTMKTNIENKAIQLMSVAGSVKLTTDNGNQITLKQRDYETAQIIYRYEEGKKYMVRNGNTGAVYG